MCARRQVKSQAQWRPVLGRLELLALLLPMLGMTPGEGGTGFGAKPLMQFLCAALGSPSAEVPAPPVPPPLAALTAAVCVPPCCMHPQGSSCTLAFLLGRRDSICGASSAEHLQLGGGGAGAEGGAAGRRQVRTEAIRVVAAAASLVGAATVKPLLDKKLNPKLLEQVYAELGAPPPRLPPPTAPTPLPFLLNPPRSKFPYCLAKVLKLTDIGK